MAEDKRNKEEIYDEEISPLMAKIIEICTEKGIAFLANFFIPTEESPGLNVTSSLLSGKSGAYECPMEMMIAYKVIMEKPAESYSFTIHGSDLVGGDEIDPPDVVLN